MGKKIATVVTNLFEDVEFTSPKEALINAGHQVITIENKAGNTVTGKKGDVAITIDKGIDDVSPEDFDALLIPGGFSPDQLRSDDRFLAFTKAFADAKKPIFSICHGPQLLINAEVVKGKKMTAVKQVGVDLINAGALFEDSEVVLDESGIISSRTPEDLPAFNQAIVQALADES
ncbi:predicted intracellular protease [Carnobacterium sp. AT7]|uniref:type 1 glutamine amidotransferase domain-containing protein n=1 Tax=Carnobacterium TaxID=2747 RepID=UPI00015F2B06|nr:MULTISPECIES: type 1 glutamine amidotransferase domain-containing protein [Carnobacterium]EDP68935.1 predicted intracellular protease [Carnobacterium sp. AT7]